MTKRKKQSVSGKIDYTHLIGRLSKKLSKLYCKEHLRLLSREVGFIKRESKLKAHMYLEMLLSRVFDNSEISLNDHCVEVGIRHRVRISKQAIDERFNEESVAFVRTLLEYQLSTLVCKEVREEKCKHFSCVLIKDSTRFQLPDNLKEKYPGYGGKASEAGMHIQFEYDALGGKVTDLNVSSALYQDYTDAHDTVEQIPAKALVIRDLGYFQMDVLQQIDQQKAYYISRLKPGVGIYELKAGSFHALDLTKIYQQMNREGIDYKELKVYIGEKKKLEVRLVIGRLPEREVNKRLKKAHKEARRRGRTVSDKYKAYACLNLFISNVPEGWLSATDLYDMYRLRWQIELRFKIWKSYCQIHVAKKMKQHRFETYLYATLLFIFIGWEVAINLSGTISKYTGKVISIMKCYKAVINSFSIFKEALMSSEEKLGDYIRRLCEVSLSGFLLEKRKRYL